MLENYFEVLFAKTQGQGEPFERKEFPTKRRADNFAKKKLNEGFKIAGPYKRQRDVPNIIPNKAPLQYRIQDGPAWGSCDIYCGSDFLCTVWSGATRPVSQEAATENAMRIVRALKMIEGIEALRQVTSIAGKMGEDGKLYFDREAHLKTVDF